MSEIENGRLGLHVTEHSKCNHLITLGFKGLTINDVSDLCQQQVVFHCFYNNDDN